MTAPDDGEFADFVRARTPALLRAAIVLTNDQGLAEDLVQSALARTHLAWHRLTEPANAEAYTRKAMYRLQIDWWRHRRIAESMPGQLPERGHDDGTDTVIDRMTVARALSHLTAKQRAVIVLRFLEDQSESAAAATLGCSVGTIKSQTAKALTKLREWCPELTRDRAATTGRGTDKGGAR